MKAEFKNILNELQMNSGLMDEIDLVTMLTMLKNYGVITDQERHILHTMGPIGRYVSGNYDHSLTRTSLPLSQQAGRVENLDISVVSPRILQELFGTILPKKVDEHMELFIKSLKIAGFTQSYGFVLTRVKNVSVLGAGVVEVPGVGVAPGGFSPADVTSSYTRMKGENPLMEEAQDETACVEVATILLSVKQCDVSYLEVYQNWIRKNRDRNNGQSTIPINEIARKLMLSKLLKKPEYQLVNREKTDEDKLVKLFNDFMPGKGAEGFKQVVNCLMDNSYIDLARDLTAQMKKCLSISIHLGAGLMSEQNQTAADIHKSTTPLANPTPIPSHFNVQMKAQNPLMVEAQEYLSKFIILNIDFMAEFWSEKLLVANTWSAYADVQILEDFKDDRGKVLPSGDYMQVFENVSKPNCTRILIQGDPGCGKSTYVNKIALNWANENEYLRKKFDLVFLIYLQTLEVGIKQAIRNLLPQRSSTIEFVEDYYKRPSSKVLLILDGFDEFPEDSPFYLEVMNMMKSDLTMSQYLFFTTIVTTRRSHVDKVPKRFHERSLLIKGFDKESMKLFLQTQNVPVPNEQTDPNLVILLQNPFFCTIYCSLHFFRVDKSTLEDPYDFVKALVENAVKKEKEAKRITNEEDQLQLLGAFAFQTLNLEMLNVVEKLFPIIFLSEMANMFKPKLVQRIDTDQIQLGLLIKKKIPAVGVEYNEEFGFPHQLIAEYLAARYFITSTKSQLKQLQPEKLVQELLVKLRQLILSSPSSLPFIRLLLLEYLNLHLNDAQNGRKLIFLNEFHFIYYCKSKSETPAINDITSLDWKMIDSEIRHDSLFFPTMAKCNQLKSLDLVDCNLSTHEATELVNLFQENGFPNLTMLGLSRNSNVGSTPTLFAALGKCKQLERLDLQECDLSIESINRLTTCMDDNCWVKLSQLDLSHNKNVDSTPALFTALGKCKQLERFDLRGCDLSIESTNRITTCMDDNCWLKVSQLHLSGNRNVDSIPALFTALGKCKQLEILSLQWGDLSIESINRLTTRMDDNCWVKLSQLDLSQNKNVGSTPALFTALGKCKQLERLDLRGCDLSIESTNRITTCMDDNCWLKLSQLHLSGNRNVGSTPALFTALGKCKQLERLDLFSCALSIESINRLTTCIDNSWVNLSKLNLSRNKNVGSTPTLFTALGKCKQLERLNLWECDLSIESINGLTTCINNNCWMKLSKLDLSCNRNLGSTPALFAALGKCKQLERLYLQMCKLSIESRNGLIACINDNCWVKLSRLRVSGNLSVELSTFRQKAKNALDQGCEID